MNKLKRTCALLLALSLTAAATACGGSSSSESEGRTKSQDDVSLDTADTAINAGDPDISGQTIYYLGIYDLNPTANQDRTVALTLFEDVYGAKIQTIKSTSETLFTDLANRINGGEPVDMFDYQWDSVPNGVEKGQYEYLDDYIDLSDPIWDGMSELIEKYKYKGHYYVVPYSVSDYIAITYSRNLIEEEGLTDPYKLYQEGKWDWDAFMSSMKTFVANAEDGETRYGCAGWFGQAIVQSTGESIINYDGQKFSSNVMSGNIEKAELLQEELTRLNLFDTTWYGTYPNDGSVLYYGMAPWHLGQSNVMNPDGDLFLVPFPKMPGADKYYLCGNAAAKMLVKNSDKGDAVAAYIKCERLAATKEEYKQAAKEKALIETKTAAGKVTSYLTEEQYDFMQTWYTSEDIVPMFDFGYGMGTRMANETYAYETRGVMNNFMDGLLQQFEGTPATWAELRSAWQGVVDEVVEEFNAKQ